MRVHHSRHRLTIRVQLYPAAGLPVMDVQVPYLPSWTDPGGCTAPLRFVELSPTFRAPDALRCNRDETGSRAVWEGPAPDLPFRPVPARLARAGPAAQRTVPGVRMSRSPVRRMDSQRLGEQD
jgi:hypothetical protein